MIAYAIKNKDGKFWQFLHNDKSEFVDDIYNAFFHYSKQDAEKTICSWGLKDCKVIEITIEEVNKNLTPTNYDNLSIEDKLKYRENQVRIALDRDVEYDNKITELEFTIKRLEEELAEKDKEIEELKTRISELQDKDWYEACIKQLEEQNDKLIKERDALQYRVSNEKINSTGIIPKPKFNIGATVIAKTINCKVVIEDGYYDYNSNKWLYQFHAPSSVMDNDYYSTYPEDYLDEIEKGE